MKRYFAEGDVANWHIKRYAGSLTIREIQIKTTMTYYYTIRMAKI